MSLTFEAFLKLTRPEQNERYRELSDHDKFRARMNDYGANPSSDEKGDVIHPDKEELLEIVKLFQENG